MQQTNELCAKCVHHTLYIRLQLCYVTMQKMNAGKTTFNFGRLKSITEL